VLQDELVGSEQLLEGESESQSDQLEGSEQSSQLLEGDSCQSGHLLDQTDKLQENSERGALCILILITVCYQVALVLHGELVFVFLSPSIALVSPLVESNAAVRPVEKRVPNTGADRCPSKICTYKRERRGRPWVQCTHCSQWCHCVGLTQHKAEKLTSWMCPLCTQK